MKLVLTLVWYPWTEGAAGPAGTRGVFKNLFLEVDAPFARVPGLGETVFFDDGGTANIEAVGWKLDGTPYVFLGKHLEKNAEPIELWTSRGFQERAQPDEAPTAETPPPMP